MPRKWSHTRPSSFTCCRPSDTGSGSVTEVKRYLGDVQFLAEPVGVILPPHSSNVGNVLRVDAIEGVGKDFVLDEGGENTA